MFYRRWWSSFGVMVALMAEEPAKVGTSICLEMDQWKMVETTHLSASDRFMPQTRYVARLGIPAFDVRIR